MKASEAKLLSGKAKELKLFIDWELENIYKFIEESTLKGLTSYHYSKGWLNGNTVDCKLVEQSIVNDLVNNGYVVEREYSNHNRPFLLISWG